MPFCLWWQSKLGKGIDSGKCWEGLDYSKIKLLYKEYIILKHCNNVRVLTLEDNHKEKQDIRKAWSINGQLKSYTVRDISLCVVQDFEKAWGSCLTLRILVRFSFKQGSIANKCGLSRKRLWVAWEYIKWGKGDIIRRYTRQGDMEYMQLLSRMSTRREYTNSLLPFNFLVRLRTYTWLYKNFVMFITDSIILNIVNVSHILKT